MSVYSVPVTLSTTTASQYENGLYFGSRICHVNTAASTTVKISVVLISPTPRSTAIQSAKLSPTVVHRILMIQNQIVISGTLLSRARAVERVGARSSGAVAMGAMVSRAAERGITARFALVKTWVVVDRVQSA